MLVGAFEQRSDLKGLLQDQDTYSNVEFLSSIGRTMGSTPSIPKEGK